MHRYALVSGTFFALVAVLQLVRVLRGWTIVINSFTLPVWVSGCAFVVAAALALWGFRAAKRV
ncbi:MAG: hypothetical protein H6Q86_3258 [candidate division NC10 bacterium]|nr:hypothetical protein [candidate division NC10 bacterium]MBP2670857.1 hypothetical protein [candidate division NC10 bacterium]